jgi:amino acid transporter
MKHNIKKTSLFSATTLSATSMIGAGWLFSAQLNAKIAGNYAFLSWFLAAILIIAIGLCLSQVVAKFPVRGATTRSSALSHNSIFGMPFAFANWFGVMVVIATEAQATTQYLSAAIHSNTLIGSNGLTFYGKLFALAILFLYLVVNYFGIMILSRINNIITVLKIFTPLFTIALFFIAKFDVTNFNLPSNNIYSPSSAITAIISAGLIYSYNGFQIPVAFSSEIINPKRNVPLSIILSVIIVMVVYCLLQLAFMGATPHAMLLANGGWAGLNFQSPLINLAMLLGLNFVAIVLVADSTISPSGTGFAYLGAASRMFYSMSAANQMPRWAITKLHPKYFLCRRSLLINWGLSSLVLWNSTNWASLMVVVTGYHLVGYMAAPISMGAINHKTKIFGFIVFIILGMIATTLPSHDFYMMNLSLMVLMLIYGIIKIKNKMNFTILVSFAFPFLAYLWLVFYFINSIYTVIAISGFFYLFVTSKVYITYCKKYVEVTELDNMEEDNKII